MEEKTAVKGGHHCDACDVHTSCLTFYIAHISSKTHKKMMVTLINQMQSRQTMHQLQRKVTMISKKKGILMLIMMMKWKT